MATEATKAFGNAEANQEKYMESFNGRLQNLETRWQTFWMNVIGGGAGNAVVDFGKTGMDAIEGIAGAIGEAQTAALGFVAALAAASALTTGLKWILNFKNLTGVIYTIGGALSSLAAATGPIGLVVAGLATAAVIAQKIYDKYANTSKKIIEEGKEARSRFSEKQERYAGQENTLQEAVGTENGKYKEGKYQYLRSKVNGETNENISLTNEEYREYINLTNQLAEINPRLVSGWDDEGNAILTLGQNIESTTEALRGLYAEVDNRKHLALGEEIGAGVRGSLQEIDDLQPKLQEENENLKLLKIAFASYKSINVEDIVSALTSADEGFMDDFWDKFNIPKKSQAVLFEKLRNKVGDYGFDLSGNPIDATVASGVKIVDQQQVKDNAEQIGRVFTEAINSTLSEINVQIGEKRDIVDTLSGQIEDVWSESSEQIAQYLTSGNAYKGITDAIEDENLISVLADSFNSINYQSMLDKGLTADDIQGYLDDNYIKPLSDLFTGEFVDSEDLQQNAQNAFKSILSAVSNSANISASDYDAAVSDAFSTIKDFYTTVFPENGKQLFDDLVVSLGVKFSIDQENGDLVSDISTMLSDVQKVAGQVDGKDFGLSKLTVDQLVELHPIVTDNSFSQEDFQKEYDKVIGKTEKTELPSLTFDETVDGEIQKAYIDNLQKDISTIDGALETLRTDGQLTASATTDLFQEFRELAGYTGNLGDALNNLKFDKLEHTIAGVRKNMAGVTDPQEIAQYEALIEQLTKLATFEGIDGTQAKQNVGKALSDYTFAANTTANEYAKRAVQGRFDQLFDAYGDTEEGRTAILQLAADPNNFYKTYDELAAEVEGRELEIGISLNNEDIAKIEKERQNIQSSHKTTSEDIEYRKSKGEDVSSDYDELLGQARQDLEKAIEQETLAEQSYTEAQEAFNAMTEGDTGYETAKATRDAAEIARNNAKSERIAAQKQVDEDFAASQSNAVDQYTEQVDRLQAERAKTQQEIDYLTSKGFEVSGDSYQKLVDNSAAELATLQSKRDELLKQTVSDEDNTLISDMADKDSETYIQWMTALNEVLGQISDTEAQQTSDKIAQATSGIDKLKQDLTGLESEAQSAQNVINLMEARGEKVGVQQYEALRDNMRTQLDNLKDQRIKLEAGLEAADSTEAWIAQKEAIDENSDAIAQAQIQLAEYNKTIRDMPITEMQNQLSELQAESQSIQDTIATREAKNEKARLSDYNKLIKNEKEQIKLSNKQLEQLRKNQLATHKGSQEWQDYASQIDDVESSIASMEQSMVGWQNTANQLAITSAQALSSAISSAMQEILSTTGLTTDTVNQLANAFSDISGSNIDSIFYRTADGVRVDKEALQELVQQEYELQKAQLDSQLATAKQEGDLKAQAELLREQAQLYAEYKNQMEQFSAYSAMSAAQSTANQGAKYDEFSGWLKTAKESYDSGKIGTDDFKSLASYMDVNGFFDPDTFKKDYDTVSGWLTEDSSGIIKFFNDMEAMGLMARETLADGTENWVQQYKNLDEAAEKTGLSTDILIDMFDKAKEYGGEIIRVDSLEDATFQLEDLSQQMYEAQSKLAELKVKYGEDSEQVKTQQAIVDSLQEQVKTVHELNDAYQTDVAEKYTQGFRDLPELLKAYKENAELDPDNYEKYLADMQAYADQYGLTITGDFELSDDSQARYQELLSGLGSTGLNFESPTARSFSSAEDMASYASTFDKVKQGYESNADAIDNARETLQKYTAEQLESIQMSDGQYGEFEDAERALDAIAQAYGLTAEEAKRLAEVLVDVGANSESSTALLEQQKNAAIQAAESEGYTFKVDLEPDIQGMDDAALRDYISSIEEERIELPFALQEDESVQSLLDMLHTEAEKQLVINTIVNSGSSEEELQRIQALSAEEFNTEFHVNFDEQEVSDIQSRITSIGDEVDMTVHIDDSQIAKLAEAKTTAVFDSAEASANAAAYKESVDSIPETVDTTVNANTTAATDGINKVDTGMNALNSKSATPKVGLSDAATSAITSIRTMLDNLNGKRVTTYINTVHTTSGGSAVEVNGTAHANGTVYSKWSDYRHSIGAYAGGTAKDWSLPTDEEALVNELGYLY